MIQSLSEYSFVIKTKNIYVFQILLSVLYGMGSGKLFLESVTTTLQEKNGYRKQCGRFCTVHQVLASCLSKCAQWACAIPSLDPTSKNQLQMQLLQHYIVRRYSYNQEYIWLITTWSVINEYIALQPVPSSCHPAYFQSLVDRQNVKFPQTLKCPTPTTFLFYFSIPM